MSFRRFSKTDQARFIALLKRYKRAEGDRFSADDYRATDPEFVGWYIHIQANLAKMPWGDVDKLIRSGFFNKNEERWLANFHRLMIFKEVMGHTRVPARWNKNPELSRWVHGHRSPKSKTPDYFRRMLDAIGFEWKLRDRSPNTAWDHRYAQLVAYRQRFGDCDVPAKWAEDKALGSWVSTQRLNKTMLTDAHIKKLDKLGFDWDILGNRWNQRYKELVRFHAEHGHSQVPIRYQKNPSLALWVANIRHRPQSQTKERLRKLKALGFHWEPFAETWEEHYQSLEKYAKRYDDTLVPAKWSKNPTLGGWVVGQRQARKFGKLDEDKIQRLDELGFVWDVVEWQWEQRFAELKAFKERFGHCRVPAKNWPENPALGTWLSTQRIRWNKLPKAKLKRLKALGVSKTFPGKLPENVRVYLEELSR